MTATTVLALLSFSVAGPRAYRAMPDGSLVTVEASDELLDRSLVVTVRRGESVRVWHCHGFAQTLDVLVREVL